MKRLIFSVLFLVSFITGFAQQEAGSLTIQPKVGINLANYRGDDVLDKGESSDFRAGLAVGAELEYQFTHWLSASFAAMYSQQGVKGRTGGGHVKLKTDYINFPVMANFYVIKNLSLKIGLQPGIMVTDKYHADTFLGGSKSGNISDISSRTGIHTNKFDLSMPVGFAFHFGSAVLDCRYNLGLTHVFKERDIENSVFQFTFGYKIGLK